MADPYAGGFTPTDATGQIGMPAMSDVNLHPSNNNYSGAVINALNVAQGIQRGGVGGYGSALVNAGGLYNDFGDQGNNIPYVSGAGNVLGIINGIHQGGVAGYGGAALNAGQLANGMGADIPYLGLGAFLFPPARTPLQVLWQDRFRCPVWG